MGDGAFSCCKGDRMRFPNLVWAIAHKRLAHYQAAVAVGMGESKFSRAINGRVEFTSQERAKIAELLGFSEAWLFQEIMPPPVDGEAQPLRSVPASS